MVVSLGVRVRLRGLVRLLVPAGPCRLVSSSGPVCYLFQKRGDDPRTGLSTGTPFTAEALIADVLLPWYWRIPQILSCRSLLPFSPVETLRRPECRLLRQMRHLLYYGRYFLEWSFLDRLQMLLRAVTSNEMEGHNCWRTFLKLRKWRLLVLWLPRRFAHQFHAEYLQL